jgi:hypothetical protein
MPICLHIDDDRNNCENENTEWREPPGRLGEYVRRVKRLRSPAETRDSQKTS